MTHVKDAYLALFTAVALSLPYVAMAVDSEPYIEEDPLPSSISVGVTLGEDWDGFPDHLMPDYTGTASTEKLDVTLPLYVTWILDQGDTTTTVAHAVNPPVPITNYSWFSGHHSEFEVIEARVTDVNEVLYTRCATGDDFEAPTVSSTPLNSGGYLHVEDHFGGIGTTSNIVLRRYLNQQHTQVVRIYLGWSSPKTRHNDYTNSDVNYSPGGVWTRKVSFSIPPVTWTAYFDNKIVEWVSTDVGSASRRQVDASDLSAFAYAYGCCGGAVRWGFVSESPASSPTFQADFTNSTVSGSQHYLDGSDISHIAYDLDKSCQLSKVQESENATTIMAWFGFTPTGRTIEIGNGETGPEYALTDFAQSQRGRTNPYGYRKPTASLRIPWGRAKGLYR